MLGMVGVLRFLFVTVLLALGMSGIPSPGAESAPPPKRPSAEPMSRSRDAAPKQETRKSEPRAPAQPAIVGTWSGRISQGISGNVDMTIAVPPDMKSVTTKSWFGTKTHPAVYDGTKLAFRGGILNEIQWTLTPASDGRTVVVTARSGFGVNGDAVFQKISNSAAISGRARAAGRQPPTATKQQAPGRSMGR